MTLFQTKSSVGQRRLSGKKNRTRGGTGKEAPKRRSTAPDTRRPHDGEASRPVAKSKKGKKAKDRQLLDRNKAGAKASTTEVPQAKVDLRKQMFNGGKVGLFEGIQVSTERIATLLGVFFDIDPPKLRRSRLLPNYSGDPNKLYKKTVKGWLQNHPVLAKAEVRNTGTGLHVILWFDEPVEFETHGERDYWAGLVEALVTVLPVDPQQPGITGTTRPLGSINSKNGGKVTRLAKGQPVTKEEVEGLYNELCRRPFQLVMQVLTGQERLSPCPICGEEGSELSGLDHAGSCYTNCGKVSPEEFISLAYSESSTTDGKDGRENEEA